MDDNAERGASTSENIEDAPSPTTWTSPSLVRTPDGELDSGMSRSQAYNLYTSHLLSTWNVRTYEFAAVIFTAAAYPDTLLAAAIRGIVSTLASICFSSVVGRWVDQSPNRLQALLSTISVNRLTVIGASMLWYFIVDPVSGPQVITALDSSIIGFPTSLLLKAGIFSSILLLGIFEALSASGNMLSMERDWVVTAAAPDGQPYDLTHLNSVMRRIDLVCALVVGVMSATSWAVEIFCAKIVWKRNPRLQAPKAVAIGHVSSAVAGTQSTPRPGFFRRVLQGARRYVQDFKNYFACTAWVPSLALALLHLSALSYGATFITFLLNVGFSLELITVARAAGSIVEICSTVVTPVGVQYLGKAASTHGRFRGEEIIDDRDVTTLLGSDSGQGNTETGLERLGLWGISWQLSNLVPVMFALWSLSPGSPPVSDLPHLILHFLPNPSQTTLAIILFSFLSLSRLGLWVYDLTTQQLTQTLTLPSQRSSFTGVEYSFVSLFQLLQHVVAIFLSRPEDFRWIAMMSFGATVVSAVMYAAWVWRMRGHLVHWEKLGRTFDCVVTRGEGRWRRWTRR
ncbi:uncharacterized protein L3040_003200 [Drepanopeziza brunnea f. sp. 'multigermtubi']|uniref:uncharacterized protein n=1 Tax=Drepanopeziza brunnea f. sp. 'multigermtubi' TaxID=698441 RepID=UPI0023913812|nr:hypothetical protein L3040_003200 [Drepanopeziza brunnea f. sp. 'multigermtubi']